jgi:hypothetical protein
MRAGCLLRLAKKLLAQANVDPDVLRGQLAPAAFTGKPNQHFGRLEQEM